MPKSLLRSFFLAAALTSTYSHSSEDIEQLQADYQQRCVNTSLFESLFRSHQNGQGSSKFYICRQILLAIEMSNYKTIDSTYFSNQSRQDDESFRHLTLDLMQASSELTDIGSTRYNKVNTEMPHISTKPPAQTKEKDGLGNIIIGK